MHPSHSGLALQRGARPAQAHADARAGVGAGPGDDREVYVPGVQEALLQAAHRAIGVAAALVTAWITLRKGDRR